MRKIAKMAKPRKIYRPKKPSKSFTKAVQKIIHKDVETKQAFNSFPYTSFNSGINSSGDICRVLPTISKGVNDNNRIGDQIRAMKLTIRGHVLINQVPIVNGLPTPNSRIAVRMMIVQPKQYSNYNDIVTSASVWLGYLLKEGGTSTSFDGNLQQLYAPINTDAITKYYDKVHYISIDPLYQYGSLASTNTIVASTGTARSVKFFKKTIKFRNKLLRYDDNVASGTSPTQFNPVLIMGYAHLDGSSPDTVTTVVSMMYDSIVDYEDA